MIRFLARVLIVGLAGVAAAFGLYQVSVQPGAALVHAVFQKNQQVHPPSGFTATEATVTETRVPIQAPGAPAAAIDVYRPRASATAPRPVILWVHGGGFLASNAAQFGDWGVLLAHQGYVVALLDYSLAPQTHYPAPVRQANAALAWLSQHARQFGGGPARMAVGGDSAGAQIASQLAAVESNPQLAAAMRLTPGLPPARLRAVVLYCGLYDMSTVGGTGFPALRTYLWAYTGTRNWLAYPQIGQLSTTRQATSAYPPTYLTVGDRDPFRTQAAELAGVLRARGVPVTTLFWHGQGLGHEYQFDFRYRQAGTSFQQTLAFLDQRLRGTGADG
ncbi:MAG: alpha/beta hydrolase [Actinobacteria bacterium]|nr:alpha/beta hydrolase [Actinomycetota bacterium]